MTRLPSALVGKTSLALTTAKDFGTSNSDSCFRFSLNNCEFIGKCRISFNGFKIYFSELAYELHPSNEISYSKVLLHSRNNEKLISGAL